MRPRARGAAMVGWVAQVEKAQASLRRQGRGRKVQAEKAQGQARELEWGLRAGERLDQR